MPCKTNTRWEVSEEGELIYVGSGEDYWRHIAVYKKDFPMPVSSVAHLVNEAFKLGMAAKAEQIRAALFIK